jgi:hypothetical protein
MPTAPPPRVLLRLLLLLGLGIATGVLAAAADDLDRRDIVAGLLVIIVPGSLAALTAAPHPHMTRYVANVSILIPVASVAFGVASIGHLDLSPGATVIGGSLVAAALSAVGALVIGLTGVALRAVWNSYGPAKSNIAPDEASDSA